MRAADNKGPPTSTPDFSNDDAVVERPQHAYRRRRQRTPMRVESSTMSDPSCGLQRAALGDECVAEGSEGEDQQTRNEEEEEEADEEMTKSLNLHKELATKRREVSHLVDEMQRLQSSINNLKEISTSKIAQLQDMVSEKDRVIQDLAEKLLRQQDYSDLKRELRLLKALDMSSWQSWTSEVDDRKEDGNRMTPTSGEESLGEEPTPSTPPSVDCVSSAHLQRCLRLNVDRFGCEPLNTLSVSRCVRELLSVNNIGQRLFAKLVLGLSQGTVSELLSKPKPWDKLTEKGRDSYRKMHAWACDQHCVTLLKAMLPRKGRDGKSESEDRSVQADAVPLPPTPEDNPEVATPPKEGRLPTHHHLLGHPIGYTDVGNGKALCHFADFPPVMLAHLYQEELLKLIGKRMKECQQPTEQVKQTEDEIRRALSIYHRELTMMAAHQCHQRRSEQCGPQGYTCREPACCMTQPPGEVKEQLSQYSISQRLFGESVLGLSQGSVSDLLARPKPWHMLTQKGREPFIRMKMFLEDENAVHKLVASQYKIAPERLMRMGGYGGVPLPPGSNRFSPVGPSTEPCYSRPAPQPKLPHPCSPPRSPSASLSPSCRGAREPLVQPSVYEMAAVTTDLDTQIITARIKETLTVHNIGQKLFGEAVLGLSQGSVSELLSKPKPWHMLSIKGREPFIRMQLWLNDPANVDKLQAIKTERREANKRRRNALDLDGGEQQPQGCPLDTSMFLYPTSSKKPRMLFSEEQKEALKLAYSLDPYPSTAIMEFLSAELGLSVRTITNWFHNHRMRLKQQNQEPDLPYSNAETTPSTFDPIRFRLLLGQKLAEMCKVTHQMHPFFSLPPFGVIEKIENTLDLSISSQQYPKNDADQEDDEDKNLKSSKLSAAIDLTDKSSNKDLTDSQFCITQPPLEFAPSEHANSTLDLSFQKVDTTSRNSTPDIDGLYQAKADECPVDLRERMHSGSNRRKPSAPQWVNPGLDLSPDSDIFEDDSSHVLSDMCVRQTDGDKCRLEREHNIRRLERAIAEHEEGWDDISNDGP